MTYGLHQGRRSLQRKLAPHIDNINRRKAILAAKKEEEVDLKDYGLVLLFAETEAMARYMGDFARPTFTATTSAIVLTEAVRNHELKPHHLALLPSYHGLANEDALTFIREYCTVVQSFPLSGLTEDNLKMKCFPYTLKDRAKSWYLSLPAESLHTWNEVCEKFMLKYYPSRKTQEVRSQIMNFSQDHDEPFHETWERFQDLLQQCPHHQMAPELIWQYFYDALNQTCQFMVDSSAGGNIAVKTADEMKKIFETLAASSQQKSARPKKIEAKAVTMSPDMTKQMADMLRDLENLKMKQNAPAPQVENRKPDRCDICGELGHIKEVCENMGAFTYEGGAEVYAAQGYMPQRPPPQGQGTNPNFQNRRPPPYNNPYPPQNSYYSSPPPYYPPHPYPPNPYYPPPPPYYPSSPYPPPPPQNPRPQPPPQKPPVDEDRFHALDANIKRLETAIGQISSSMHLIQQPGRIPSQGIQPQQAQEVQAPYPPYVPPIPPQHPPTYQAQSISVLRDGRTVDNGVVMPDMQGTGPTKGRGDPSSSWIPSRSSPSAQRMERPLRTMERPLQVQPGSNSSAPNTERPLQQLERPLQASHMERPLQYLERPLPSPVAPPATETEKKEGEAIFHKAPNPYVPPIPFPSRLKDKKQGEDKQMRSHTVAAVEASQIRPHTSPTSTGHLSSLPKQGDPGSFTLDVRLDNGDRVSGMLDLGAAVNLMPYSIYERMGSRDLKPTDYYIELADGSLSRPLGIMEDVVLLVGGIRVLADFVVLDVGRGARSGKGHLLLLGRPFMATTQTRIDVGSGTLSMAGKGGSVTFSVFRNSSSIPTSSIHSCSYVKLANPLVEESICEDFNRVASLEELIEEEDDEFFSCMDEEEDIEQRLRDLEEIDEVEEENSTPASNATIYKDKVKRPHDKKITYKEFKPGMKVLLCNSRLRLFPGKLKSTWGGPYTVVRVFPHGAVEVKNEESGYIFSANGQDLKPYIEGETWPPTVGTIFISDPPSFYS